MSTNSKFFSWPPRFFRGKKKDTWEGPGNYMDSKEFDEDIFRAVKKGAEDQDKFMKSVGASWGDK